IKIQCLDCEAEFTQTVSVDSKTDRTDLPGLVCPNLDRWGFSHSGGKGFKVVEVSHENFDPLAAIGVGIPDGAEVREFADDQAWARELQAEQEAERRRQIELERSNAEAMLREEIKVKFHTLNPAA